MEDNRPIAQNLVRLEESWPWCWSAGVCIHQGCVLVFCGSCWSFRFQKVISALVMCLEAMCALQSVNNRLGCQHGWMKWAGSPRASPCQSPAHIVPSLPLDLCDLEQRCWLWSENPESLNNEKITPAYIRRHGLKIARCWRAHSLYSVHMHFMFSLWSSNWSHFIFIFLSSFRIMSAQQWSFSFLKAEIRLSTLSCHRNKGVALPRSYLLQVSNIKKNIHMSNSDMWICPIRTACPGNIKIVPNILVKVRLTVKIGYQHSVGLDYLKLIWPGPHLKHSKQILGALVT